MQSLIFLDVETTGFDSHSEKIIEVGLVKWSDKKIIETFQSLVNPGKIIPREITMLTGISQVEVDSAPTFGELSEKITAFIGESSVVGHNIQFDLGFLRKEGVIITGEAIDTVELAQILLIKEASYSLEVLMKKYELPMRKSHRALDDTLTTVDFFEFLLEKMNELPPKVITELQSFLSQTSWPSAWIFQTAKPKNRVAKKEIITTEKCVTSVSWGQSIIEAVDTHEKILIESPYEIPFEKYIDRRVVFAYARERTYTCINYAAEKYNVSLGQYKSPRFYVAPNKVTRAIHEWKDDVMRVPFLAKIIIWLGQTVAGDREEMSLRREEYSLFNEICDRDGNESFYMQAYEESKKSTWIIAHHTSIWDEEKSLTGLLADREIIISDAHMLEDSLTNSVRIKITPSDLNTFFGEKGILITGLLGILYQKQKEYMPGRNGDDVLINENTLHTIEWKHIIDALHNLPEHPWKNSLLDAFTLDPHEHIAYISLFAEELSYNKVPVFLGQLFAQGIAGTKRVLLHDYSISGDGTFSFIRELLELDSSWYSIIEKSQTIDQTEQQLLITIPTSFPEPHTEGFFRECSTLFMKLIEQHKGRCLFVVNAKAAAFAFHNVLAEHAEKNNVQLLSFGQSGGIGKIIAHYIENPDQSVVIATSALLPYIEKIIALSHVVVLNRIPFDPPFHAVYKARSEQYIDAWNEYFLPRALMKFRHMLVTMGYGQRRISQGESLQKNLCILDSRLKTKSYGRLFLP